MMRNFGISLLFLGLLAAGIDGFRERARVRNAAPNSATTVQTDDGLVHTAEFGITPPK
jgi:hypothetical protein